MVSHQNIVVETTDSRSTLLDSGNSSNPEGDSVPKRFFISSPVKNLRCQLKAFGKFLALAPDQITPIPNVSPGSNGRTEFERASRFG